MPGVPFIETFTKSVFTRADVEIERQRRLEVPGAMSSVITEDAKEYILTTMLPGADDPPAVLPGQLNPAAPLLAAAHRPGSPAAPLSTPTIDIPPGGGLGLDTFDPASSKTLKASSALFGQAPSFWGRYFHAPGRVNSSGKVDAGHYSTAENKLLRQAGVRVLPIARQTGHVGRGASMGTQDAERNAAAILEVFSPAILAGTASEVLVFLDCELGSGQPPLSAAYYSAWAAALAQKGLDASGGLVRLVPAVYASRSDVKTWAALGDAIQGGASCAGAWVAAWVDNPAPIMWTDHLVLPQGGLPVPALAWQYSDKGPGCDTDVINPAHKADVFSKLPIPP